MEKLKCSECGSNDIVRDGWFLKCTHCKARFNLDSTGKASQKLDELLDVGITALENEDYRNASSFFKQAMACYYRCYSIRVSNTMCLNLAFM